MKRKLMTFLAIALLTVAAAVAFYFYGPRPLDKQHFVQSTTPTIFFHGYGSSSRAERHMANAARRKGVTNTIIDANVNKNGNVSLKGNIPETAVNPIVLVNYENNRSQEAATSYPYLIVRALQDKYHFAKMNMVGHSMGNLSILYYMRDHADDAGLPQLEKQVDIAGHFNGIIGFDEPDNVILQSNGKPDKETQTFQSLLPLRNHFSQNQVDVLNIYGDIGDGTDQRVSNNSSQTLRYLLAKRAKSYREVKIDGKDGQHSRLHESGQVDDELIAFLWGK